LYINQFEIDDSML